MAGNPNFYFAHKRKKEELQKRIDDLEQQLEEVRQQLEASQNYARGFEENTKVMLKEIHDLQHRVADAEISLEASQKISEERRVALRKCNPWNMITFKCELCRNDTQAGHKPNCDYCRLVKD